MTLVLFGAGLYIFEPFIRRGTVSLRDDYAETPLQGLLSQKDTIYSALKDLEFDYQTGKLSDDDYEELRKKFTAEASTVLEEIDSMRSSKNGGSKAGKKSQKTASATAVKERTCDKCGFAHEEDDKFCQSCGADLV